MRRRDRGWRHGVRCTDCPWAICNFAIQDDWQGRHPNNLPGDQLVRFHAVDHAQDFDGNDKFLP